MAKAIKVKLVKSGIGYNKKQQATLTGLGLRKLNQERILENTSSIRGMLHKVQHLVEIEPVDC